MRSILGVVLEPSESFWSIQEVVRERSEVVLERSGAIFGLVLGLFWGCSGGFRGRPEGVSRQFLGVLGLQRSFWNVRGW